MSRRSSTLLSRFQPDLLETSRRLEQSFNLKSWPHNAKSHEPVLVLGADTVVGLCVVQLAHCCGHKVIAVAENNNRKRVEEFGADVFIDRKTDMLPQKIREATQNNLQCSIITTYMVSHQTSVRDHVFFNPD